MHASWYLHLSRHSYICQLDHFGLLERYCRGPQEVRRYYFTTNSRTSIDKTEEPAENSKNIMTPFDGGLSFADHRVSGDGIFPCLQN